MVNKRDPSGKEEKESSNKKNEIEYFLTLIIRKAFGVESFPKNKEKSMLKNIKKRRDNYE